MAKVLGVDKARPALGALVDKVVDGGEPVIIAKRTGRLAVLLSYEEYTTLTALAEGKTKTRLRHALREIRRAVRKARLPRQLVDEALQATRALR